MSALAAKLPITNHRKSDTYLIASLKQRWQYTNHWPYGVWLFTVTNLRTGTVREMSHGQVMKRRRKGLIRIDERLFMQDRIMNGVKQ